MRAPRSWTLEELTNDSGRSRELFRQQRLDEPLALYWSHCLSDLTDFIESTRLAPEH